MSERYKIQLRDAELLSSASVLLRKIAESGTIRPAQMITVAKLQHILAVLPHVTQNVTASASVCCPRHTFADIETFHWWDFGSEDGRLRISSGGHFHDPRTGGDTFATVIWEAIPEEPIELNDYRESLWMVPDVQSYSDGVESIDLAAGGYTVEILDDDNPLLEENQDKENEDEEIEDEDAGVGADPASEGKDDSEP
jgi:hypothetical protein